MMPANVPDVLDRGERARRRGFIFIVFALAAGLLVFGCKPAPQSFKDVCAVHNKKTPGVTLRGVFLTSKGDLIYECDRAGATFRARKGEGRGCPLTMYPDIPGKLPAIEVFFHEGTATANIKPFPDRFDWNKDIHVVAPEGSIELGDTVEVTGTLDTMYGDCTLSDVTSVKLVEDRYGPGKH